MKRGCRSIVITSGGAIADEAAEAGVPVVRVPGGMQPRAALGWLGCTALGALEAAGLLPPLAEDVAEAADESPGAGPRRAVRRYRPRTTRRSAWRRRSASASP